MRLEKLEAFSGIILRWPSGEPLSAVIRLSSGKDIQSSVFIMLVTNLQHCMPQNLVITNMIQEIVMTRSHSTAEPDETPNI